MSLTIDIIDALHVEDNYNYLLRDEASGKVAVVDASDAEPILAALKEKGWGLDYILTTHHHWDHVSGVPKLIRETGAKVVGYEGDAERIPHLDIAVNEKSGFALGETHFDVMFIPGHTLGHIAYYSEQAQLLFPGDTLFSIGCGRMFEGTPDMMHKSMQKLAALPDETRIYAGHEYTLANLKFALSREPENAALLAYQEKTQTLRDKGLPTLPSLMKDEKALNPFLRAKSADEFGALRSAKDNF